MLYDWDAHHGVCYQLYIKEGRSLEEIMGHMKDVYKFAPSKRAFQTQFRRWNFPSKIKPAYKNNELVNRIKELWERNLAQREMLEVLKNDGFEIKHRELMRVRLMHGWFLRSTNGDDFPGGDFPNADFPNGDFQNDGKPESLNLDDEDEPLEDGSSALVDQTLIISLQHNVHKTPLQPIQQPISLPSPDTPTEVQETEEPFDKYHRKKKRKCKLTLDPTEAFTRFPSEMTIDEARLILGIDLMTYRMLRSTFQKICQEENMFKKTVAGQEKWEGAKTRLITSIPELQRLLWLSDDNLDHKKQAFDVICTDVTKRMRMLESRMSLADAKNRLGVNPQQSREVRSAFQQVLSDAQMNCKSDVSPQQMDELKRQWAMKSDLIKKITDDIMNEQDMQKVRALEILARDVIKRIRDQARKEPKKPQEEVLAVLTPQDSVQEQVQDPMHDQIHGSTHDSQELRGNDTSHSQTSPLTADQIDLGDGLTPSTFDDMSEVSHASHMSFSSPNGGMTAHLPLSMPPQEPSLSDSRDALPPQSRVMESSMPNSMTLDSQLSSSLMLGTASETAFLDQPYVSQEYGAAASPSQVFQQCPPPVPAACAIYLRLHATSTFMASPPLWISTINSHSLQGLRQAAVEKFPGAICLRVEGILKYDKCGELPLPIEQDQELSAYLVHLQGAAPTFNVQLVWKPS